MTNKATQQQNYLVPFIIMVVVMALVGLITSLNQQFQAPMKAAYLLLGGKMTNTLTTALNFSFFSAYLLIGPVSANYVVRNGHKKTLILGLAILCISFLIYMCSAWVFDTFDFAKFESYIEEAKSIESLKASGIGAMQEMAMNTGNFSVEFTPIGEFKGLTYTGSLMIPIAYWVFLAGSFVAGTALTYLQTVINPYILACDVKGTTGIQRQSISGTFHSLMTTLAPLFVAYVIFGQKDGLEISLSSLYLPFAILFLLVVLLNISVAKIHLPEVIGGSGTGEVLPDSVWSFSHFKWGFIALFCYLGVEVCVAANVILYAQDDLSFTLKDASLISFVYWAGCLTGRFVSSFLNNVSAQKQLLVGAIGGILCIILAMITEVPWFLGVVGLFHSIMWPAIFALALDGLGRYTSKASGILLMGCFGGALLPFVQGILADAIGGWGITWILVVIGELYILYYSVAGYKIKKRVE